MLVNVRVLAESKGQIRVHVPNASECLYVSVTSKRDQMIFFPQTETRRGACD